MQKIKYIIGIDEAGRGPLAGPLAVGGVRMPYSYKVIHEYFAQGIRDSKKLTPSRREKLFEWIQSQKELQHAVAFAPAALIDSAGVTISIEKALTGVLQKLISTEILPEEVLVLLDGGLKAPERFVNQKTIIRGDENEMSIALASVAAKVVRDRRMVEIDSQYPKYGFSQHKGYGTKAHFQAIKKQGTCPEHRQRFLRKYTSRNEDGF